MLISVGFDTAGLGRRRRDRIEIDKPNEN